MKNLNYPTLLIFAPILVLTGALGFVLPEGPMSNAPAYNIFHICFGAVGLLLVIGRRLKLIRVFNIGFGLIDLYQALASFLDWFPESFFHWKPADDILHIVIGSALVLIGLLGNRDD
ncbi:MAG: DUF4383 domain-containing protein [Pyrinomonadaceae bacterium]